jgi:predicted transposase/invertase (TIGR01784 family)
MTKLEYTFKTDTLFKMLFRKHQGLLKNLIATLLNIQLGSIENFLITNPEIPPESLGDKFCRLDINMVVNGQQVNLEIQVDPEQSYPDRILFYWAKSFASALGEGEGFSLLPRTVHISIVNFAMFDCEEFHSEFQSLEVTRHTPLTDKKSLHIFELPKLPVSINKENRLHLWLSLFNANTEEDLKSIEALEVPEMNEAIGAYRHITVTPEFKEAERLRSKARHDEAQALYNAAKAEREKWQGLVAEKDATLADKDAALEEQARIIAKLQAAIENRS